MTKNNPVYSLIIPIFNEYEILPALISRLSDLIKKLDATVEIICVDDGSSDKSAVFLRHLAQERPEFRLIELSRNFGHQIAITAGMDVANGDAVIVMDADLQDPPEVVLELIAKWKDGFEIVYARRIKREGESAFKRFTAHFYYRLLEKMTSVKIPKDVGDFRLVSRKALDTFKNMPEHDRFVRGMFAWMGLKQTEVEFERPERAGGETKYTFRKMIQLATNGIVSFSQVPLRFALWVGFLISFFALCIGIAAIITKLSGFAQMTGWASTIVIISFLSGINLFMTGIIGLYVGGIYSEVKRRPLYVVGYDSLNHPAPLKDTTKRTKTKKKATS
jgi:polyisoprenyl-phosphate glycosyltransferase